MELSTYQKKKNGFPYGEEQNLRRQEQAEFSKVTKKKKNEQSLGKLVTEDFKSGRGVDETPEKMKQRQGKTRTVVNKTIREKKRARLREGSKV